MAAVVAHRRCHLCDGAIFRAHRCTDHVDPVIACVHCDSVCPIPPPGCRLCALAARKFPPPGRAA